MHFTASIYLWKSSLIHLAHNLHKRRKRLYSTMSCFMEQSHRCRHAVHFLDREQETSVELSCSPLALESIIFWGERTLVLQASPDDSESKSPSSWMKDSLQRKATKKTGPGRVFQCSLLSSQSARGAQSPSHTDLTREPFCYGASSRAGVPWSTL